MILLQTNDGEVRTLTLFVLLLLTEIAVSYCHCLRCRDFSKLFVWDEDGNKDTECADINLVAPFIAETLWMMNQ